MKKIIKNKIFSFILILSIVLSQASGIAGFNVKAAENAFSVQVVVESNKGVIADATSDKVNAFDALQDALGKAGIDSSKNSFPIDPTFKSVSLKKIDDISAGNGGDWMYEVNRNNSYVDIQTGIDGMTLQNGDRLIVYYGAYGVTLSANKISYSTNQANSPLVITLENYSSWTSSLTPINNINAKIYYKDANNNKIEVLNNAIKDNKINISSGLKEGTYTLELSDFKDSGMPNVVADSFNFIINKQTQNNSNGNESNAGSATPSTSPYDNDNSKITKNIDNELKTTENYIKNNSTGDAWAILSLTKLGIKPDLTFIKNSAVEVKKDNGLGDFTNTDLEKLIMTLTASGYSPYKFMGYNLVSELYNRDLNSFLINDAIYGLITMNYANISGNYAITKDKLIDTILKDKLSYNQDGSDILGWTLSGNKINPDITGLAINALSPYYTTNSDVKASVDKAVSSLSILQNESGYIADNFGYSSESLDMVILGLTSVGINPEGTQFTKSKGDLVSALLSFKGTDGAYKHNLEGKNDYMASEEALRALIALKEFKSKGSYNYYAGTVDSSKLGEFILTEKELLDSGILPQTGSFVDFSLLIGVGACLILAGVIILLNRKKIIE